MKKNLSPLILSLVCAVTFAPSLAVATALSDLTGATANNLINSGDTRQTWQWNTLSNGIGLDLNSGGTSATNGHVILQVETSGAISTANQTTTAGAFFNSRTGTNSTNVALSALASGGTHLFGIQAGTQGSTSDGDAGVYGAASGTGAIYGVKGLTNSSTGYGGYFTNTNGGYAAAFTGGNVGIGTMTPVNLLDIGTSGGIHIASGVPGSTSMALYNNSGTLTWNGIALATGSSVSGTTNYVPVYTGASSLGNSVIYQNGSNVGIGTTGPQSLVHAYGGEVQVGSSGASCATANNGAIRFSGAALYYCTGTTWTSVSGGASGSVSSGTAGQVAYYQSTGTTVVGTSTINILANNVGIGTASPAAKLDINTGANTNVVFGRDASFTTYNALSLNGNVTDAGNIGFFAGDSTDPNMYVQATGGIYFRTGGSSIRAVITSTGNVGINTLGPTYTLQVNGSVAGASAYVNTSDARYKKNVKSLEFGLNEVMKLKPVSFEWKDEVLLPKKDQAELVSGKLGKGVQNPNARSFDPSMQGQQIGLVAQDVEKILPSVVVTENNAEKTKGMKYSELIPVLIKGMQEQQAEIDDLKKANAAMKSKLGM